MSRPSLSTEDVAFQRFSLNVVVLSLDSEAPSANFIGCAARIGVEVHFVRTVISADGKGPWEGSCDAENL